MPTLGWLELLSEHSEDYASVIICTWDKMPCIGVFVWSYRYESARVGIHAATLGGLYAGAIVVVEALVTLTALLTHPAGGTALRPGVITVRHTLPHTRGVLGILGAGRGCNTQALAIYKLHTSRNQLRYKAVCFSWSCSLKEVHKLITHTSQVTSLHILLPDGSK